MRSTQSPLFRRCTAALLAAAGALSLTGCQLGTPRLSPAELRESLLADHRAKLEGRADEVRLERRPSEFESSLERTLDKARADGIQLPEGRRTVEQIVEAADEMSGAQAYRDTELNVGTDLLTGDEADAVSIGLRAAIRKAVAHNLDLAVARLNPQISAQQVIQAQAAFDTVLFAGTDWTKLDTPRPPGTIPGLSGDQQSETLQLRTGIRQQFDTGAQLVAQAQVERSWSDPSFFGVNRFYDSDVLVQLTQPLLRGFGTDVNRANIELAKIARQAELENLRSTMLDLAVSIEQAYWQLVAARQSLLIQQRLYERTVNMRDKLRNRFGFDVLLADLNEIDARVDQRRADVLRSQQNVRTLSDRLKRLINDPDLPVIGETILAPTDQPADVGITFSLLDEVTTALQQRPEIETALLQIEDADVRRVVADNQQLPILNLTAAATLNGLDVNDPGDALGNTTDLEYIDYALGVEFERPWGNRAARSLFEQRTLERQRALENYRLQAQVVTLEVKDALRSVDTNYRLIATTRSQRRASSLSLEVADIQLERGGQNAAEGFTTRVDRVLARQDALAQAELAEVQALSDYMIAISELRRATGTSLERAGVEVSKPTE
jgi:outer membrane protein TolC